MGQCTSGQGLYQGYFGRFDFWVNNEPRGIIKRLILKRLMSIRKPLGAVLPRDKRAYSPFCGVIARLKSGLNPPDWHRRSG
jgi:hypothetical protein